jgi:FkbM family methyltransferase
VAWDIFHRRCYEPPIKLPDVRRVVDLGANVGYSCLYWLWKYPDATVIAFEPHPEHLRILEQHLSVNNVVRQVSIMSVAAGTEDGHAYLGNAGSSSTLRREKSAFPVHRSAFPVQVVDVFNVLGGMLIDLLKIDIEGGEYDLLADARFASLNVRSVVVEWHNRNGREDGREWCFDRLRAAGFRTQAGVEDAPMAGLVWGVKG